MRHLILPIINTKRLTLRPLTLEDSVSLFEYAKNDLVGPSAGWKPHKTVDETVQFIEYAIKKRDYGQPGIFAIVLKRGKKMIGTIEIHSFKDHKGEIGFVLNPKYWNKGYMTEAAKAVIIYGFEYLGLSRLQYGYFPGNEQSKRVCEKLDFKYEGVLRNKYLNYDNTPIDEVISSLTIEDYKENKISWLKGFNVDYKDN